MVPRATTKLSATKLTLVAVAVLLLGGVALKTRLFRFGSSDCGIPRIHNDIDGLMGALMDYKKLFGEFPPGDSRAVCRALSGNNSKRVVCIYWNRRSTSPEGDFLDPWGTPYNFYFSGDWPLIRSAGENKKFEPSDEKGSDDYFKG